MSDAHYSTEDANSGSARERTICFVLNVHAEPLFGRVDIHSGGSRNIEEYMSGARIRLCARGARRQATRLDRQGRQSQIPSSLQPEHCFGLQCSLASASHYRVNYQSIHRHLTATNRAVSRMQCTRIRCRAFTRVRSDTRAHNVYEYRTGFVAFVNRQTERDRILNCGYSYENQNFNYNL